MPTPVTLASAHGLQGMIELVYVQAANDLLYSKMLPLQSSLSLTQQAIDVLAKLQNLHNQIKVSSAFSKLVFDYLSGHGGTITSYNSAYQTAADLIFNQQTYLTSDFATTATAFKNQLISAKILISTVIIPGLVANGASTDPNGLLQTMRDVLADIRNPSGATYGSGAGGLRWLEDGNSVLGSLFPQSEANAVQANLTQAVTAAQSLNTTQTEKVRSYLFLFEEYYKSAAAILTQISQIIQKIAQNAGR